MINAININKPLSHVPHPDAMGSKHFKTNNNKPLKFIICHYRRNNVYEKKFIDGPSSEPKRPIGVRSTEISTINRTVVVQKRLL